MKAKINHHSLIVIFTVQCNLLRGILGKTEVKSPPPLTVQKQKGIQISTVALDTAP